MTHVYPIINTHVKSFFYDGGFGILINAVLNYCESTSLPLILGFYFCYYCYRV